MCNFFSFITNPDEYPGKRFYFDWEYRKNHLQNDGHDSHSTIARYYKLNEDECNKYEFDPLTKVFIVDQINNVNNDRVQAEDWVNSIDFRKIVEPLVIKPIINPLLLPKRTVTELDIVLLKQWASVGASVWASVGASVGDSVRASVGASVGASVWDSVWDSVWAYTGSFFNATYRYDISSANRLWESGLVPSFDGTTWRLHSGKKAKIVFEITEKELKGECYGS
jgi:hypothetical protein